MAISQEDDQVGGPASSVGTPVGGVGGGANSKRVRSDAAEWSESAINALLDAFGSRYIASHRGNLRGKDWADVTRAVNARGITGTKTVEQCRNKIDNLKKRFKLEREKGSPSTWPWFRTLDAIVGRTPKRAGVSCGVDGGHRSDSDVKFSLPIEMPFPHPPPQSVTPLGNSPSSLLPQAAGRAHESVVPLANSPGSSPLLPQSAVRAQESVPLADSPGSPLLPQVAASRGHDDSDPENVAETPYSSQRDSHNDFKGTGKDLMSEMTNSNPKINNVVPSGPGKPNRKKRKNVCQNACQAGKDVAASIAGFAEVFAKIEFAKMELFKDMELRRLEMQYKLAKLAHGSKKGRTNSMSSGST